MVGEISIEFKNKLEFLARLDLLETQIDEAVGRTAQFFALTEDGDPAEPLPRARLQNRSSSLILSGRDNRAI